jgi:hypothetical protein
LSAMLSRTTSTLGFLFSHIPSVFHHERVSAFNRVWPTFPILFDCGASANNTSISMY